ncbi:PREDICTED: G2/mitotic-specific cyclin-B3-like isoform X2 [Priapulus caudatus]|uniref:G2/mitotic-specific cyclin-B3-like isoform X2 n=1 Tax=Priapulus caudatus TaxID=37621 RepID=A0ABM1DXA2_PRICU|nr:PREDICTED: G2/mitotic-specific cyclin-B3-like isoform X2 [Priapulus caudatus]XP_014664574.1 PREDICTED: G2/mitotic-specific cyclin-B3-like isoform X2 [Priapulus caudatus]
MAPRPSKLHHNLKQEKHKMLTTQQKRPAEKSPETTTSTRKRPAFGDLTNALTKKTTTGGLKKSEKPTKTLIVKKPAKTERAGKPRSRNSEETYASCESSLELSECISSQGSQLPSSQDHRESFEDSLCLRLSQTSTSESEKDAQKASNVCLSNDAESDNEEAQPEKVTLKPEYDVDDEFKNDIFHVPDYAYDIFLYYKSREAKFAVGKYLDTQVEISASMRAILVDWLVEVQENFELNHETLYLAVKIIDLYLSRVTISKEKLQLVGSTAIFIACKFDERCPPLSDDFLYICDDAYNKEELIKMEQMILKALDFDLGTPSSYRFLRRYAKCAKANMELLTLARYICELSLQDYEFVDCSDSKLGAACLLLAMQMKSVNHWGVTMEYYSGYSESDLMSLARHLNSMLSSPSVSTKSLKTIKTKYSHKVFFEVAKIPFLDVLALAS